MTAPFKEFERLETHHCVTGSLLRLYRYYEHNISEDMLFGLGEGTGFIYWHQKGQMPFVGGRANPDPSVEELAAQRTGVQLTPHTTTSARKAEKSLLALLDQGVPVMLQVDMGFLPYMDFHGIEYHFGGHVILACGYDAATESVLIADRDADLHPVPLADLAAARGSTFKPFPPKNKWWVADFSTKRQPTRDEILTAIHNQATLVLQPPISNMGVAGIRKAATRIPQWPTTLSDDDLRMTLFNVYIFVSPVGGSGGGAFRYMFSRFLTEAAEQTGMSALHTAASTFASIADEWAAVGEWFKRTSEADTPSDQLGDVVAPLQRIASLEEQAWQQLVALVG